MTAKQYTVYYFLLFLHTMHDKKDHEKVDLEPNYSKIDALPLSGDIISKERVFGQKGVGGDHAT
jgi:hypothetical protein